MGKNLVNVLGVTALALASFTAGCNLPTNTVAMQDETRIQRRGNYHINELNIGSERYMALELPADKTAKVGDVVLDRTVLLNQYLVPYTNSTETIIGGEVKVTSPETYVFANVAYQSNEIGLNTGKKPEKSRVIIDRIDLEEKLTNGAFITTRKMPGEKKKISGVEIGDKDFYIMAIAGEAIAGAKRLQVLLLDEAAEPITRIIRNQGKEQTEFSLQGFQYVPVKANLVDYTSPIVEEAPQASNPETTDTIAK